MPPRRHVAGASGLAVVTMRTWNGTSHLPIRRLSGQAGVTLIELMISMALGLMIAAAMLTLYVNISSSNAEIAKSHFQIESGRYTIQTLESDISHAGYWGGYVPAYDLLVSGAVPADVPDAVPDPCLAYTPANWTTAYKNNLIGITVQSLDAAPGTCAALLANRKANTDVLVIRHAETCLPGTGGCAASGAGELHMQTTFCETEGHAYVLTDYPANPADAHDASHFDLHKRPCGASDWSDIRRYVSYIYYIRDYSVTAGDGIPTLMRATFGVSGGTPGYLAAEPIVEGIDGFRVEFGIDSHSKSGAVVDYTAAVAWQDPANRITATNRGDGEPDSYVRCTTASPCTAAQLVDAVTVKLYVLARNKESSPGYTDGKTYTLAGVGVGPFNDNFKRHAFTTTVRLNNVSGRRETP